MTLYEAGCAVNEDPIRSKIVGFFLLVSDELLVRLVSLSSLPDEMLFAMLTPELLGLELESMGVLSSASSSFTSSTLGFLEVLFGLQLEGPSLVGENGFVYPPLGEGPS